MIADRLLAVAAVTAIVSARVYTKILPHTTLLPAVRIQLIDAQETPHLRGAGGPYRARVQVDAVASSGAAANALDAAIYGDGVGGALAGWRSGLEQVDAVLPIDVREDFVADAVDQFRIMRDYLVLYH